MTQELIPANITPEIREMIPTHRIRAAKDAFIQQSERGRHYIEFQYLPPADDTFVRMGLKDPNEWLQSWVTFTRKPDAERFIKMVNAAGEEVTR